jgi:hypothetical protein
MAAEDEMGEWKTGKCFQSLEDFEQEVSNLLRTLVNLVPVLQREMDCISS